MTFGIDISGYQSGMDLVRARAEGVGFVIVKAVAQDTAPGHTVAAGYHENVDATIAAGFAEAKGHYQAPHAAVLPEQAARFLAENVHRYSGGDVFGLDNEPLGAFGTFWNDAQCARYFRAMHAQLGHPYERMWLYCPAYLTRQHGPWPECEALGVKFWWVAYGARPTGQTPDHEPSLQGVLSRWDVHQFTDRATVAGRSVDGNYSPHAVTDLFGGVEVGYLSHRPAKGNMNQGFGPRPKPTPTSPAIHYGQDYGWGGGDAIYAARAGVVREYAYAGSYGNRMVVDHGEGRQTWYCHLDRPVAARGTTVEAGEHIAWMGATGNVTAKHLHFELRLNGVATDPEPFFTSAAPSGGGTTPIGDEIDMATLDELRQIVNSAVHEVRKDLAYINNSAGNPDSLKAIRAAVDAVNASVGAARGDINYVHQVSPYSLKAIAESTGDVVLSDVQVAALSAQLTEALTAALPATLDADFEAVVAAIKAAPADTVAALKEAL